jgi:hypothetical protein
MQQHDLLPLMLDCHLPWLSPSSRALLDTVARGATIHHSPQVLALRAGFRNRYQLGYVLRRSGFPPYRRLVSWLRLLTWLSELETQGRSLCELALRDGEDPAYRYRLAKRLTGEEWSVVRDRGLLWGVQEFASLFHAPAVRCVERRSG